MFVYILLFYPSSSDDISQKDHFHEQRVHAFFWIDYRIIEFIGHLSFCKKREFYDGDSEKNGAGFFVFVGYKKKEIYLLQQQQQQQKKEQKSGNWDLISFPSFIRFTFMLNCRLYNT